MFAKVHAFVAILLFIRKRYPANSVAIASSQEQPILAYSVAACVTTVLSSSTLPVEIPKREIRR